MGEMSRPNGPARRRALLPEGEPIGRRDFLELMAKCTVGAGAVALPKLCWGSPGRRRPNIVVILADDISARDFGCYGHPEHRTPVLDRLGEEGVRFETCWATPICSPSRAEIMTGRYGFRTRWYHNNMRPGREQPGGNLSQTHHTIGQLLKRAGYATAVAGKWQLHGTYAEYGFDEHCMRRRTEEYDGPETPEAFARLKKWHASKTPPAYWHPAIVRNGERVPTGPDDYGPDVFADFIIDFMARHREKPFFVYYPMVLAHKNWDFDAERIVYHDVPRYDEHGRRTGRLPGSLPSNVECTDRIVGRIASAVERLGLREDTILFFTTDNGTPGGGKVRNSKGSVVEERGQLVPMIVHGPGRAKNTGRRPELIDFSDVLPTLLEFAETGLPEAYEIDGRSFAPLLEGRPYREREWIFSYLGRKRMLRTRRWLLDGRGRLFDCGDRRDEQGYLDVSGSDAPEVAAVRRRFEEILAGLPAPQ